MLGIAIPPAGISESTGGTAETIAALVTSVLLVVGVVVWIRSMQGRGRVVRPTGVNRLRPAAVH